MPQFFRSVLLAGALLLIAPTYALASVQGGPPFPSNLSTTVDLTQLTGLRVALPKPDCAVRTSDCEDIDVLNSLDGFNVDARVSIPFSGPIDLTTVTPSTVFLADPSGRRVPLDRLVWTAATNTLHGNPQTYLDQHTPYVLVVTDGVKAADGANLSAGFRRDLNFGQTRDARTKVYRAALLGALHWSGVDPDTIVDASLFTTQSITSLLEKVRRQIDASTPAPATFAIGTSHERAVFPFSSITSVTTNRQVGTGAFSPSVLPFSAVPLPVFPGAIGTAAYGRFTSPDYENAQKVIPAIGTGLFSSPAPQGTNPLYFNLWLPSGTEPAGGWPVAIVGHGFTDSKGGF